MVKTVYRNNLVEYYLKEESLLATIEEHIPPDKSYDEFFERLTESMVQKLNDPKKLLQMVQFLSFYCPYLQHQLFLQQKE